MNKPLTFGWVAALSLFGCARSPERPLAQKPGSTDLTILRTATEKAQTSEGARTKVTEQANRETAILAGGCFWGMEDILREAPGVLDTEVGYAGGSTESPSYETVKTGRTGHAESVRIVFDPSRISYAELLEKWFFRMHDPTTKDRQGNDRGTQYRSAIFTANEEQAKTAREVIQRVDASGKWGAPIVTEVVPAGAFTPAEDYHQDYLEEHPNGYTCHFMRN